jgi:hypothetical protein
VVSNILVLVGTIVARAPSSEANMIMIIAQYRAGIRDPRIPLLATDYYNYCCYVMMLLVLFVLSLLFKRSTLSFTTASYY